MIKIEKMDDSPKITAKDLLTDYTNTRQEAIYLDEFGQETTKENAKEVIVTIYDQEGRRIKENRLKVEKPKTR